MGSRWRNHCGSCAHEWTPRKSALSDTCPKCKSGDVRAGSWKPTLAATPTGPQMQVQPPPYPPQYQAPAPQQQWHPPAASFVPVPRQSSFAKWVLVGAGVLLVGGLLVGGCIVAIALSNQKQPAASARTEPTRAESRPALPAVPPPPPAQPLPPAPAPAPKLKPGPPIPPSPPPPPPTVRPDPPPSPPSPPPSPACQCTCRDGACGCCGRGCCSGHGGIAR